MSKIVTNQKRKTILPLYWTCQLSGWGLVSIYWAYIVYFRDNYGLFYTFLNYILDAGIGIGLTHIYRYVAIKYGWSQLLIKKLLVRVIPAILLLSVSYMTICNFKWHGYWNLIQGKDYLLWDSLKYWDPILITGIRLMSIWILAYHLYHYYQREVKTAKMNAQLSLIAKQAQLDNLAAQLNPHFLFNSLNSIKSLVIESPTTARRAIDLLSDLLRSSLYDKGNDLIRVKDELALVKDYVELEKMRFEERLSLALHVNPSLLNFKLPTLSIQLLVENAIKHGIDARVDGGIVELIIEKENQTVQITVTNPGSISNEKSSGLGLKNLQERLRIQFKGAAKFTLTANEKEQVSAIITLPIQSNENI